MAKLFVDEEVEDDARGDRKAPLAPTVRQLVQMGYSEALVTAWSRRKAELVLAGRKREAAVAMRRAAAQAAVEGQRTGEEPRGQPSIPERLMAAAEIRESLEAGDLDELAQTLGYTIHALSDPELVEWATGIVASLSDESSYRDYLARRRKAEPSVPS